MSLHNYRYTGVFSRVLSLQRLNEYIYICPSSHGIVAYLCARMSWCDRCIYLCKLRIKGELVELHMISRFVSSIPTDPIWAHLCVNMRWFDRSIGLPGYRMGIGWVPCTRRTSHWCASFPWRSHSRFRQTMPNTRSTPSPRRICYRSSTLDSSIDSS